MYGPLVETFPRADLWLARPLEGRGTVLTIYLLSIRGVWGAQSGHLLCVVTSMLAIAVSALEPERRRSLGPVLCALTPNLVWSLAPYHHSTSDIVGPIYMWSIIVTPGILLSSVALRRFSTAEEQPRAVFFVAMLSSMMACFNAVEGVAGI